MNKNQKGYTLVETLIVVCIIGIALAIFSHPLARLCGGINQNYSNGARVGVVTKLSQKGVIWKSWEGEMLMALPASTGTVQPEKFEFNVSPEAVDKVTAAMKSGHRIELVYRQWWSPPMKIDHDYVIVDVKDIPNG
jgi:prepilin-type N-terminal cleavage/methylation domain-containing protein